MNKSLLRFIVLSCTVLVAPFSASAITLAVSPDQLEAIVQYQWLLPMVLVFSAFSIIISVALYVYSSLAYMTIANKLGVENAWLAWVPITNVYLITRMAGMSWAPMLLMAGFIIPIVNVFCIIIFTVFSFVWMWKIFEKVGRPGWWVLLGLIPFVGALVLFILLGVAAWGKGGAVKPNNRSSSMPS